MLCCTYHPETPATGICMRCKEVICPACTTRVGGINHCVACLEEMAQRPPDVLPVSPGRQWSALLLAWVGLLAILWLARGVLAP
jgi:hypothetical protein